MKTKNLAAKNHLRHIIFLFALSALLCGQATLTNILTGSVADYGLNAQRRVAVTATLLSPNPRTIDNTLVRQDPVATTTDGNGAFAFTNFQWGIYSLNVQGQSGTQFKFIVGTNTIGTTPLASLISNSAALPPNPATNYYTQAQVDALLSNLPTGGVSALAIQTNESITSRFIIVTNTSKSHQINLQSMIDSLPHSTNRMYPGGGRIVLENGIYYTPAGNFYSNSVGVDCLSIELNNAWLVFTSAGEGIRTVGANNNISLMVSGKNGGIAGTQDTTNYLFHVKNGNRVVFDNITFHYWPVATNNNNLGLEIGLSQLATNSTRLSGVWLDYNSGDVADFIDCNFDALANGILSYADHPRLKNVFFERIGISSILWPTNMVESVGSCFIHAGGFGDVSIDDCHWFASHVGTTVTAGNHLITIKGGEDESTGYLTLTTIGQQPPIVENVISAGNTFILATYNNNFTISNVVPSTQIQVSGADVTVGGVPAETFGNIGNVTVPLLTLAATNIVGLSGLDIGNAYISASDNSIKGHYILISSNVINFNIVMVWTNYASGYQLVKNDPNISNGEFDLENASGTGLGNNQTDGINPSGQYGSDENPIICTVSNFPAYHIHDNVVQAGTFIGDASSLTNIHAVKGLTSGNLSFTPTPNADGSSNVAASITSVPLSAIDAAKPSLVTNNFFRVTALARPPDVVSGGGWVTGVMPGKNYIVASCFAGGNSSANWWLYPALLNGKSNVVTRFLLMTTNSGSQVTSIGASAADTSPWVQSLAQTAANFTAGAGTNYTWVAATNTLSPTATNSLTIYLYHDGSSTGSALFLLYGEVYAQ